MTTAPLRILVVEDNAITRKMVRVALEAEGYTVVEAPDGTSALRLAEREPPALVVQDIVLPDMDGFELVGRLRALPPLREIPILAFTGFLSRLDESRLSSAGFDEILSKPIEPSRLARVVASYLGPSAGERPASRPRARAAHVLVVDDDPVQLKLQKAVLAQAGFDVATASGGVEALAVARAARPDVILADVLMPGMDGFRLTAEVRRDGALSGVPVVLSSSHFVSDEDRSLALRVGAQDLVVRTSDLLPSVQAMARALEGPPVGAPAPDAEAVRKEYLERIVAQLERQAALNSGLREQASLRAAALSILGSIADTLARQADVQDSLQEILAGCVDAAGLSRGAVYIRSPGGGWSCRAHLGFADARAIAPERLFGSEGWLDRFAEAGEFLVIAPETTLQGLDVERLLAETGASTVLLSPLASAGGALGVLALSSAGRLLQAGEWRSFAQAVAGQLGQAIALGRAFSELAQSESRYRSLYRAVPVGLFRTALDGAILDANPAFVEMFGFPDLASMQAVGAGGLYVRREDRRRWLDMLVGGDTIHGLELELRRRDGTPFWGSATGRITRNEAGEPVELQGAVADITERKRAQAALGESEERFRQLAESIREAFFVVDLAERRMLYVSPTFEEIWGRPASEIYERAEGWVEGLHPRDRRRLRVSLAAVARGEVRTETFRVVRTDASLRWVRGRAFPVLDAGGRVYRLVGVAEDITQLRQAEEQATQAQKLEAVGRLAGGVAHDFNNLLTVILTESDLMSQDLPPEHPAQQSLQDVRKACDRAVILTRQLLAFSRRQLVEPQVLRLNDVVADMDRMLRRLIGEDIEIVTQLSEEAGSVRADRGQLEQVVTNLAVNARDAMPNGGTLTLESGAVSIERDDPRGRDLRAGVYAMLTVSDTGSGMTDEVKARLFEPFFTTKGPGKGTGLGLATCYGIVKQAGGHIAAYSEPGLGSRLCVYLPRIESQSVWPAGLDLAEAPSGDETILVVEDEPAVRSAAARLLRSFGYQVIEARDGQTAFDVADAHEGAIHLLLTDVVLPRMGGREVADRVRAARPSTKVLFMSGYTDDMILRHRVLEEGVPLLEKPFTRLSLTRKVREVLDG